MDNAPLLRGKYESLECMDAVYIRQKLQVLEQCCTMCEKENLYFIGPVPLEMAETGTPQDDDLKNIPVHITMKEHSTCLCRVCCGPFRAFTMDIAGANGEKYGQFRREWRCCCQDLEVYDEKGQRLGGAFCECDCYELCCGNIFIRIDDTTGETKGYIKHVTPSLCNGCTNCCAPSCCNPVWDDLIVGNDRTSTLGRLRNVFPGLGCRCLSDSDNYLLSFPENSSRNDKLLWLGGLVLTDFVFNEKRPNQNHSN
mmetsp:Transcript_33539/g.94360  ORF Transcript_33539/g.94360 Transcript_33539/m.94360 type:complete len:254 (+) Transcript_33539:237-998(+)